MILFPAIDIRNGKCVRLIQGDFGKVDIYGDPVEMALKWEDLGAEFLHIVDLDGALRGDSQNFDTIQRIFQTINIPIQVGGGVRSVKRIDQLLTLGVKRVILGSAAIQYKTFVNEAIQEFGESIAVSIDAKNGYVATDGWTNVSEIRALDFAKSLEDKGLKTIVYTDIAKDGMLSGPNFHELEEMNNKTNLQVIASGGVSSIEDVKKLAKRKLYGAIIGKALYTGNIDFEEALKEVTVC